MALASYSPFVLRPLSVPCPIYPAKGYSATIEIGDHAGAPTVSLTDLAAKTVMTRLGGRLRVAGTAELSGYGTELNPVRCEALVARTFDLFPDAGERGSAAVLGGTAARDAVERAARRPHALSQPIPRHRARHARLDDGLRLGPALADVIAGRSPQVDFAFART